MQAARHIEGDSMDDVFGHLDPRLQRIWADGSSGRIARRWSATDDWLPPQWLDFNAENSDRLSNGLRTAARF